MNIALYKVMPLFIREWPTWAKASPSTLASNGFYFTGSSDRIKCIYCHGVLHNWVETDHEHKRHSPNYPHEFDDPPVDTENREERLTCKICMIKEISAVFLDCGHFAACIDCAIRLDHCPICRDVVRYIKRIYF